jgi:hypothetical protein
MIFYRLLSAGFGGGVPFENSRYATEGDAETDGAERHSTDLSRKRESLL